MIRKRQTRRTAGSAARVSRGYPAGHAAGYEEGLRAGYDSYGGLLEGTSIIIPSYNQVDFLKMCVESIREHTGLSYEIIVVDNASTDGTADYLRRSAGQVRYRILEANRGFAGAVNVGMMMAKGTTMLLLNNDTLVTERWLDNMLLCLNSDPNIGMVGPVTNYISGDQCIGVPYTDVRDMQAFAKGFNVSDSSKWQRTDRLTGFCLLFRRELWENTGFLDEIFAIGNYEDDDYNIRVRLQGYALTIARDAFIHHFGSVSMKALGDRFTEVNGRNMQYYMDKWGNPHELIYQVKELRERNGAGTGTEAAPAAKGETAFFPEGVVVRGTGQIAFWVEGGIRRPIDGDVSLPIAKLPQVDIRRWPIGMGIPANEAEERWHGRRTEAGRTLPDGMTAQAPDGTLYLLERGRRRKVASRSAAEAWSLQLKPALALPPEQLGILEEGLPIIAPARRRRICSALAQGALRQYHAQMARICWY